MINNIPMINVNLAKKPIGPFAPKRLSLLPLYAPSPIEELFWSKTATVITIAKINCKIIRKVVKILSLNLKNKSEIVYKNL